MLLYCLNLKTVLNRFKFEKIIYKLILQDYKQKSLYITIFKFQGGLRIYSEALKSGIQKFQRENKKNKEYILKLKKKMREMVKKSIITLILLIIVLAAVALVFFNPTNNNSTNLLNNSTNSMNNPTSSVNGATNNNTNPSNSNQVQQGTPQTTQTSSTSKTPNQGMSTNNNNQNFKISAAQAQAIVQKQLKGTGETAGTPTLHKCDGGYQYFVPIYKNGKQVDIAGIDPQTGRSNEV